MTGGDFFHVDAPSVYAKNWLRSKGTVLLVKFLNVPSTCRFYGVGKFSTYMNPVCGLFPVPFGNFSPCLEYVGTKGVSVRFGRPWTSYARGSLAPHATGGLLGTTW